MEKNDKMLQTNELATLKKKKYWGELPFPSLGDLPKPEIKPASPLSAGRFFNTAPPGKPRRYGLHFIEERSDSES